jgi:hypothetical protein
LVEAAPGALLFIDEVNLVLADVFGVEKLGRTLEVAGEQRYAFDVRLLSLEGIVAQT